MFISPVVSREPRAWWPTSRRRRLLLRRRWPILCRWPAVSRCRGAANAVRQATAPRAQIRIAAALLQLALLLARDCSIGGLVDWQPVQTHRPVVGHLDDFARRVQRWRRRRRCRAEVSERSCDLVARQSRLPASRGIHLGISPRSDTW